MPDDPDGFESGFDADGRKWFGFFDRDMTRWENADKDRRPQPQRHIPVMLLRIPRASPPAQPKDLTEE